MTIKCPQPTSLGGRMRSIVADPGIAYGLAKVAGYVCVILVGPTFASVGGIAAAQDNKAQITVAMEIPAKPESVIALSIQVGPRDLVPRNSFIRLRGMPPTISLTEGYAIGPGTWAIPLIALPTLKATVPVGISGRSELSVTLVAIDGTLLAEGRTVLVVEAGRAIAPADRTNGSSTALPPVRFEPDGTGRKGELSAEERADAERLVASGKRYLELGNIEVARQFFQRAANAGFAAGALSLAGTYDPDELARLRVQGVVADRAEALRWYDRARELGAPARPTSELGQGRR
jgi:hypothetical protein